eukprot:436094-Prorocentrum_minimum.AAC.1
MPVLPQLPVLSSVRYDQLRSVAFEVEFPSIGLPRKSEPRRFFLLLKWHLSTSSDRVCVWHYYLLLRAVEELAQHVEGRVPLRPPRPGGGARRPPVPVVVARGGHQRVQRAPPPRPRVVARRNPAVRAAARAPPRAVQPVAPQRIEQGQP